MSLTLKEAYYTEETKWVHNHTTIEKYHINTKHVRRHINNNTKRPPTHHKKRMWNDRDKTHT